MRGQVQDWINGLWRDKDARIDALQAQAPR
jgi:hypothetical protein